MFSVLLRVKKEKPRCLKTVVSLRENGYICYPLETIIALSITSTPTKKLKLKVNKKIKAIALSLCIS